MYHLPIEEAAAHLGIGTTVLKKVSWLAIKTVFVVMTEFWIKFVGLKSPSKSTAGVTVLPQVQGWEVAVPQALVH